MPLKPLKPNNYELTKMPRSDDAFNKITCMFLKKYNIQKVFARILLQKNIKYLQLYTLP